MYTTVAQVIPVLLLALMWDSAYLDRLRGESRPPRQAGAAGYFWTKPRVRLFILAVAVLLMAALLIDVLVLAGVLGDSAALRGIVVGGLVLAMGTLLFRIWVDVVRATGGNTDDGGP